MMNIDRNAHGLAGLYRGSVESLLTRIRILADVVEHNTRHGDEFTRLPHEAAVGFLIASLRDVASKEEELVNRHAAEIGGPPI